MMSKTGGKWKRGPSFHFPKWSPKKMKPYTSFPPFFSRTVELTMLKKFTMLKKTSIVNKRIRNFYITIELELKIGTCNNHNRLYLWSHFQRYSCTCIEDIYTKLVKSSVFPYILISSHLYLLGHNDSRAENSHGKHKHVYVLMYEFSGALVSRHRRYAYASDHKTLYFPCFFLNRWFIYYARFSL